MANGFYVKGAEKILAPIIGGAALTGTLKAMLVKNTYVQNLAVDEFVSQISAHRVGADQLLGSKSVAGGRLDAADPVFAAVAVGSTAEALVLYMDTGDEATSPLLMYLDQAVGFPKVTDGGDITPRFDDGAYKIVSLV
jgi:hypothetical protein